MKKIFFFFFLVISGSMARAQYPLPNPGKTDSAKPGKDRLDSLLSLLGKKQTKTRPYESVIKGAVAHKGLFTVYEVRDSVFFEIPDTLLHREIEFIQRLVKGTPLKGSSPGGGQVFPGELLDQAAIYFSLGPDSSLVIYEDKAISQSDSNSRINTAVKNAYGDEVVQTMRIIAWGPGRHSYIIDATALVKGASFITAMKDKPAGSNFHLEYVHNYPINVEFGIYQVIGSSHYTTNVSFIALPRVPMPQRLADRRVGYFADMVHYFADDQQKALDRHFINRWRLEPREEDRERWTKGELVEPQKSIVIYIDPATPKQWRKYLIMGINDWQKAFEQAGFKNAIMGKEWPEGDSANLDDARYSFVCYLPSPVANAYGPNIHDPRSGEIIQTHIGWYHNVMSLVHDWYQIQAAATDPRARQAKFDEDLMGQLIRFVSSHEVGHTLGLAHNFGSSSRTPVEKMRDKSWLDIHGHTASIMDYARFNYVAQPEDNIPEYDLWPRIGEYDRWAIQWGYKYSGATDPVKDKEIVSRWVTDSLEKNPRLWFGTSEDAAPKRPGDDGKKEEPVDPRSQTEDLGDNNMTANAYGIKNLKRILPNLPAWCHEKDGDYNNLEEQYGELLGQFKRYMGHVLQNVGGIERTWKSEEQSGDVYAPVPRTKQEQALAFFNEQLFITPTWLLDPAVTSKIKVPRKLDFVADLQIKILNTLIDADLLNSLGSYASLYGAGRSLPPYDLLSRLHKYIWVNLATGQPMDLYRRNLQKSYIGALADIKTSAKPEIRETEAYALACADMDRIKKEIMAALPRYSGIDRDHLESQIKAIGRTENVKP